MRRPGGSAKSSQAAKKLRKLIFTTDSTEHGGAEDHLRALAAEFYKRGNQVRVLLPRAPGTSRLVAQMLEQGIATAVLHMHTVKPLDVEALLALADPVQVVVTVEEHSLVGGLGSSVAAALAEADRQGAAWRFKRIALPDSYPNLYGSQRAMMEYFGVSRDNIVETVAALFRRS